MLPKKRSVFNLTYQVRRKFGLVMEEFGLGGEVAHADKEVEPTKALFRDKKLTRLWEKVPACFSLCLSHEELPQN